MLPFPIISSTLPCSVLLALAILMAATTSNSSYAEPTTMLTAPYTTKPGCQRKCGNVVVPYPFGIGPGRNCSMKDWYDINCDTSFDPPKAFLNNEGIEIFNITETQMRVENINLSYACYGPQSPVAAQFRLSSPSYTFSADANRFTVVGCDNYAFFRELDTDNMIGGCISVCSKEKDLSASCSGLGCCQTSLPKGLKSFSSIVEAFYNNHTKVSDFDKCAYAFLGEKDTWNFRGAADLKAKASDFEEKIKKHVPVVIEWTVGTENCSQVQPNSSGYACQHNTTCVDFDGGTGYRCQCLPGYEGNPYLSPGCTDIDECADPNNNPCVKAATCHNPPGNYRCKCPNGYIGDGMTNGFGCIYIGSRSQSAIVGLSIGLGSILLFLIGVWLFLVLRRRKQIKQKAKFFERNGGLLLQQQLTSNDGGVDKTKIFSAAELEKATDSFNVDRILGQGGQGTVYKGMLSDGKIVAIKKSKVVDQNQLEEFINEVVILSQINHRSIVKLLGCCLETEVPLLVYEFIPNGTLFQNLHDPSGEFPITWEMRLQIAKDAAGALAYLHSDCSIPIYHRDIKSLNILLDEKYRAKVSDFGISRSISIDQTHLTTRAIGTHGYMDPGYFVSNQFTEKSDVYSFAVVLVELLTGQKAIRSSGSQEEKSLVTWFLSLMESFSVLANVDPLVLKEAREEELLAIANLAKRCLSFEGKLRPRMKEVAMELEAIRLSHGPHSLQQSMPEIHQIEILTSSYDGFSTAGMSQVEKFTSQSIDKHPLLVNTA
ncbi:hypothetical protein Ancab_000310 [Ancistrocladus abbreviatus]